jgi:ribulose-phosphate 3-epimerase
VNDLSERLRASGPQLSVGILSADLLRLGEELDVLAGVGVELIHVDVMDGVFCPAMTAGPPIVQAIPDGFLKDVHLMVDDPLPKLQAYVDGGADIITFHVEAAREPLAVLRALESVGVVRGVALKPGTSLDAVVPLIDSLELILVLAVEPGLPGQSYGDTAGQRIAGLREAIGRRPVIVAVDGGVTRRNISAIAELDVEIVVSGSAVFDGDLRANVREMATVLRGAPGRLPASKLGQ